MYIIRNSLRYITNTKCCIDARRLAIPSLRLPYESELSTAYAQMCTRIRVQSTRGSSTPMSGQKSKEDALNIRRRFRQRRISFARLTKTSFRRLTLRCEPYSAQSADRIRLPCRVHQKTKGTHKASLSLFGGTDGS